MSVPVKHERITVQLRRLNEAKALAFPEEPTLDNVKLLAEQDRRPQVAAITGGSISVFFVCLMLLSAHGASKTARHNDPAEAMFEGLQT